MSDISFRKAALVRLIMESASDEQIDLFFAMLLPHFSTSQRATVAAEFATLKRGGQPGRNARRDS
jgi:hypothetical protein